jgi:hypothetical protein
VDGMDVTSGRMGIVARRGVWPMPGSGSVGS